MTATREIEAIHGLPESVKSSIWALSILIDRIGHLPEADRNDLFELLLEWRNAEDDEDRRSIHRAMDEILAQEPVTSRPLDDRPAMPARGSELWCDHVGRTIRRLREEAGLNQTQLAERAGLTQSHISRIENAEHRATTFTLEKIAKALNVPVGEIEPRDED